MRIEPNMIPVLAMARTDLNPEFSARHSQHGYDNLNL